MVGLGPTASPRTLKTRRYEALCHADDLEVAKHRISGLGPVQGSKGLLASPCQRGPLPMTLAYDPFTGKHAEHPLE